MATAPHSGSLPVRDPGIRPVRSMALPPVKWSGERFQRAREAIAISRTEFAARVGVTLQAVLNWESGFRSPKAECLAQICALTSREIDFFFVDAA